MVFVSLPLGVDVALPEASAFQLGRWLAAAHELLARAMGTYWPYTLVALFHATQSHALAHLSPASSCTGCGGALRLRRAPLERMYALDVYVALASMAFYLWDASLAEAHWPFATAHLVLLLVRMVTAHERLAHNTLERAASTALARLDDVHARLTPEAREQADGYQAASARASVLDETPASAQRDTLLAFFTANVLALARTLPEPDVAALRKTLEAHASAERCPRTRRAC